MRRGKIEGCRDCDPCLGGRPDQCAVGPIKVQSIRKRDNNWEHELTLNGVHGFVTHVKNDGLYITVTGWDMSHYRWKEGDRILLIVESENRTSRYLIEKIRRPGDPSDMYFMDLRFLQRTKEGKKVTPKHQEI